MSASKRIAEISNKIKELNSSINKISNPTGNGNTKVYSRELDDKIYQRDYLHLLRQEEIAKARDEKLRRRGDSLSPYNQNRNLSIEERRAATKVSRMAREGGYRDGISTMEDRARGRVDAYNKRQSDLRKWRKWRKEEDEKIARERNNNAPEGDGGANQPRGRRRKGEDEKIARERNNNAPEGGGGANQPRGRRRSDDDGEEGTHSRWVRGVGAIHETDKQRIEREKREIAEEEQEKENQKRKKEEKEFGNGIKVFAKATDKFSKTVVDVGHGNVFGVASGIGKTLMGTGNPIAMLGGAAIGGGMRIAEMLQEKFRGIMEVGALGGGDASLGAQYKMSSGLTGTQRAGYFASKIAPYMAVLNPALAGATGLFGATQSLPKGYENTPEAKGLISADELAQEQSSIAKNQGYLGNPRFSKQQAETSILMRKGWFMNNNNKRGLFWERGGKETYESDIRTALNTLSASSIPKGYEHFRPSLTNLARNEQISQNLYGTQSLLASRNARVSNDDAVGYMAAFQTLGGSGIGNRAVNEMNNMVQSTSLGGTEMKQIYQMNTAKRVAASQLKREQGSFTWEEMMSKAFTMAQKGTDREYLAEYVKGANQMGGNNPWASKLIYSNLFDQMSPDAVDSLMKNQEGFRKELLGAGNRSDVFNDQALSEAVERMTTTFDKTGNKLSTAISLLAEVLGISH